MCGKNKEKEKEVTHERKEITLNREENGSDIEHTGRIVKGGRGGLSDRCAVEMDDEEEG